MGRKGLFAKKWQECLAVPVFFFTLLAVGCQSASYTESQPAGTNQSEEMGTETSPKYLSGTSTEDCLICGEGKGTALPLYRGQENLGIINLNTFDLAPVTINLYDDFGNLIEKLSTGSATHITNTGRDGFFFLVTADTNRGYARGHLFFRKDDVLDIEKAAFHLCTDCLNWTMDNCRSDVPLSMGVINFRTGEIRLFEEKIPAFMFGDYYVSCDSRNTDDEDLRSIELLIFYCPERYSE